MPISGAQVRGEHGEGRRHWRQLGPGSVTNILGPLDKSLPLSGPQFPSVQ